MKLLSGPERPSFGTELRRLGRAEDVTAVSPDPVHRSFYLASLRGCCTCLHIHLCLLVGIQPPPRGVLYSSVPIKFAIHQHPWPSHIHSSMPKPESWRRLGKPWLSQPTVQLEGQLHRLFLADGIGKLRHKWDVSVCTRRPPETTESFIQNFTALLSTQLQGRSSFCQQSTIFLLTTLWEKILPAQISKKFNFRGWYSKTV